MRDNNRAVATDGKEFLFSVIVPVYKTEDYVEETLNSVFNQTIGFRENIQLILVNNCTPDNAGAICEKYAALYPENVVYVELEENRGPSGGRNAGIPYVRGKYVNFLDSDDKWEEDAYEQAYKFFETYGEDIDLVSCRMHCFDASDDWTIFDYKYKKSMVCNIKEHPDYMQFNGSSVIVKSEILLRHRFDEESKYAEDLKFVSNIILDKGQYGILREAVFNYRRRQSDGQSQMQVKDHTAEWYLGVCDKCYLHLVNKSIELYGEVIFYVQHILMQDMCWRIMKKDKPESLTDEEFEEYIFKLKTIAGHIDDYVINRWPNLYREYKIALLKIKYGEEIYSRFELRHGKLYFNNLAWCDLEDSSIFTVIEQHISNGKLQLDCKLNLPFPKNYYQIVFKDNCGNEYPAEEYPGDLSNFRLSLGVPCLIKRCIRAFVPLDGVSEVKAVIRWGEVEKELYIGLGKFSRLSRKVSNAFLSEDGYVLKTANRSITVEPFDEDKCKQYEKEAIKELFKKKHKRALFLRIMLPLVKLWLGKKQLWIIADRGTRAQDNGEYLFRYLHDNPVEDVKSVFVISKRSPDFKRMKKYGKVVNVGGVMHQLLFLAADFVMSSSWGYSIEDPLGWHRDLVSGLLKYKYVYLDHALTKDDISEDVNKHQRNFALWTTGSEMETESIVRYPYGYLSGVPVTTGLARYDAIYPAISAKPEKRIVLAPTWRRSLAAEYDSNGMVKYNPQFVESEFFKFYNDLMNDERLVDAMRSKGYVGELRLHPIIQSQSKDFDENDVFTIQNNSGSYEDDFFSTALIVTDYSSIAMDYGYAMRPVIYAQFDKEEFYKTHSYHVSYFDYETDGFGPVCYDYESTVQALLKAIDMDCYMDEEYKLRREEFFAHIDSNNCERIVKAVLAQKNERTGDVNE